MKSDLTFRNYEPMFKRFINKLRNINSKSATKNTNGNYLDSYAMTVRELMEYFHKTFNEREQV